MKRVFYFIAVAGATLAMACNGEAKKVENEENEENVENSESGEEAASDTEEAESNNVEVEFIDTVTLCDCGTCEQCLRAQEIEAEIAEVDALIAENGDNSLDNIIDKRSYAIGLNLGLGANLNFSDLELDYDTVKEHIRCYYLAGEEFGEVRAQNDSNMQMYIKDMHMPYVQAKYQREAFEEGGVTEGMPELPELFNEQFTKENVTRMIGYAYGGALKDVNKFNYGWFIKGFNDALAIESADTINSEEGFNAAFAITQSEMMEQSQAIAMEAQQRGIERYNQMVEKNLEESNAWLAEIEKEEGVQKSESGLLYRVEREGEGEYPTNDADVVEVHYEGTLRTGEVFDSSYKRDETAEFPLNRVIKGWTEGLKYINEGGKITLWIPSELAYGTYGQPGSPIGPNEALKFEVELFKVTKSETETEAVAE